MAFRTQKISQMTPKGANLEATDLIEVSTIESGSYVTRSITGQEIIDAAVGNVDWGDIGGTLSAQTDLQTALNGKENTITAGTTSQYFRGDKTFQTLDKAAVGLGNVDNTSDANKPISTATQTALNAKQNTLSLTTTGSSGASTLVGSTLNVPNYTLSGLGGVPTSRTLTINGVTQDLSADRTFTISTGITIGSTAIASGVVGRVLFEGAGNVVQESSSLFWDATNNRLGIGTSTPTNILTLNRNVNATDGIFVSNTNTGSLARTMLRFTNDASEIGQFSLFGSGTGVYANKTFFEATKDFVIGVDAGVASGGTSKFQVYVNGYNFATSPQFTINSTGNVLINTTTDASFKLDVNGTARVKTDLKIETTTGGLTIEGDASGYPTLKINTLRSGTTRRNWMFATEQINGGDFILYRSATAGGVANTLVYSIFNDGNFGLNTSTNAGFRLDVNGTARVQSTTTIGTSAFSSSSNLLTLISDQGSFSMRVGGGSQLLCSAGITSSTFQSNDFVQCVRVLVGSSARLNGGTLDWLSITNWAQSSLGSGNVSANLATFGTAYATINASAQVEIASTTKGFLPPRMTTTQKNAIATPAAGLMVYDTTLNVISYYNGSMWI